MAQQPASRFDPKTRPPANALAPGKETGRQSPGVGRHVCLQIHATGVSPWGGDRIIEIACVELRDRKLTGHDKHFYLNPGCAVQQDALAVHGITHGFLRNKPIFATVAKELQAYLQGATIVMYFAPFTSGFLDMELARLHQPALAEFTESMTDILELSNETLPGRQHSLAAVSKRLGLPVDHGRYDAAMQTARQVGEIYLKLTHRPEAP